jgi:hypothetical protein
LSQKSTEGMSASDRQLGNEEDNELILDHQARYGYVILLSCYLDVVCVKTVSADPIITR